MPERRLGGPARRFDSSGILLREAAVKEAGGSVDRVSEIVDNVLQLSRREPTKPQQISLSSWIEEFVDEFGTTLELAAGTIDVDYSGPLEVRMDPSHLRQICWNLCENAITYAAAGERAYRRQCAAALFATVSAALRCRIVEREHTR